MMQATVPLWKYSECKKLYKGYLDQTHVCAGGFGSDTCQGDSGGALQCKLPFDAHNYNKCHGWIVRGITSFGKGCNLSGIPGVYVDLTKPGILNWIADWRHMTLKRDILPKKLPQKLNVREKNGDYYKSYCRPNQLCRDGKKGVCVPNARFLQNCRGN